MKEEVRWSYQLDEMSIHRGRPARWGSGDDANGSQPSTVALHLCQQE
jgi:hypothetical protein